MPVVFARGIDVIGFDDLMNRGKKLRNPGAHDVEAIVGAPDGTKLKRVRASFKRAK